MPDRPLTDEEKAKLRGYQVAEILRRRNGDGPAAIAEADAPAGPARPRACPKCGKPYGQRARCYRCKPPNPVGRTPCAARPGPGPEGVPVGPEGPMPPPDVPSPTPSVAVAATTPPPVADAPDAPDAPDVLDVLRAVCEVLARLPDGDARWVLEAANLYRCRR